MKIKHISICILLSILFAGMNISCNDWLDVEQVTEKKANAMFNDYNGFKGALAGCYLKLTSKDLYGTSMTMAHVESLGGLWDIDTQQSLNQTLLECEALSRHDYGESHSENSIKRMYGSLYNVILEANLLLKGCREKGSNIGIPESRAVIEGEGYAIRALCHFDILRLFGQLPANSSIKVSLPYSEITSLEETPSYLSFEDFVGKIESDLNKAEELLKDNDPICKYSYADLYYMGNVQGTVTLEDDFMTNRRVRMNYWAVKALQARIALYLGNKEKAYKLAMEVIGAVTEEGKKTVSLSSASDYGTTGTDFTSSSECLFGLHILDMYNLSTPLLAGGEPYTGSEVGGTTNVSQIDRTKHLVLTAAWLEELFKGVNTATDIRYKRMWSQTKTNHGFLFPSIRKYFKYRNNTGAKVSGIIPILRLSEMYLIAVEAAPSISESNRLYAIYMESKNVLVDNPFTTLEEINEELAKEYRREFFAEGQMFFYYKRHNMSKMWSKENQTVSESDYILPLPNTEYNPNKK